MRIATKLILGSTIGMLLILALHAVTTFRRETKTLEADAREEGERLAHAVALAAGREWDRNGRDALLRLVEELDKRDNEVQIGWVNPGEAADLPEARTVGLTWSVLSPTGDLHTYFVVPSASPGSATSPRGVIEIVQDMTEERQHLRDSILQLGIAVVFILALNAIVATVLSRYRVTRPTVELLEMATAVGTGDLKVRLSFSRGTAREFVELGNALNQMAEDLENSLEKRDQEHRKLVETEAQLRHAERLMTVGTLASGIAHELGTPLSVISGHAKMIARGQVDEAGAIDSADTIATHVDRITAIIKQLLGFARRSGPVPGETDLLELTGEVLTLLSSYAKQHDVEVRGPVGVEAKALVDTNHIRQVLTNLITNGVQAMPDGGTLTATVETVEAVPPAGVEALPGPYVRISIQDEGLGMSPEQLKHIFEPFFTTKDVGAGTGLGLSVVHGIVQEHGGWIAVHSDPNQGSTFSVYVPAETT